MELGEISKKKLKLVKSQFFYEFLKLAALLRARPSTRENGVTSFQAIASVAPVIL